MPLFAAHSDDSKHVRRHGIRRCWLVILFPVALANAQSDGRQELALTGTEADYVRAGMRDHVVDIQALLAGLANNDLDGALRAARSAGTRSLDADPNRPPRSAPSCQRPGKRCCRRACEASTKLPRTSPVKPRCLVLCTISALRWQHVSVATHRSSWLSSPTERLLAASCGRSRTAGIGKATIGAQTTQPIWQKDRINRW